MKTLLFATIALSVMGCATLPPSNSRATERMLAAAGFQMKPADTAEKLAHLQTLPSGKILQRQNGGETYYVYADRDGCACVYVGTQPQYARYTQLVRQQTAADEARLVNEDASDVRLWGLGAWP